MAKWVSAAEAVAAITPGANIVLPPGCGEATAITTAIVEDSERLKGSHLYSGLLLGTYPFLAEPCRSRLSYGTWHVMRPVREDIDAGRVDFYPLRASRVFEFLKAKGIDVAVVQVSPPDRDRNFSLGVSTSYSYPVARKARMVIAEVNPAMPRTRGACKLHESEIAFAVETDHPVLEYQSAPPDEISNQIAVHIEPLIPDHATLQIGIGGIPEAVLLALKKSRRKGLRLFGMGIDSVIDLGEAGMLSTEGPAMIAAELMGTKRLFDWVNDSPRCEMCDFSTLFDPTPYAIERLVSVNSALEIDLWGNANSEVVGGSQMSGVGGSLDFMLTAARTPFGKSIVALGATAKKGTVSKIVARLGDVPQTIQRNAVQYVVTEYGAVDLSVLSLDQRAEAMIKLAAPQFRDGLANGYAALRRAKGGSQT